VTKFKLEVLKSDF